MNIMKYKKILQAATPATIAAAALALSLSFPIKADSLLIGYGCVLALTVILAVEYRIKWKWLTGL